MSVWDEGEDDNVPIKIQCSAAAKFMNVYVWDCDGHPTGLEYLMQMFGACDESTSFLWTRVCEIKGELDTFKQHKTLNRLLGHFGARTF